MNTLSIDSVEGVSINDRIGMTHRFIIQRITMSVTRHPHCSPPAPERGIGFAGIPHRSRANTLLCALTSFFVIAVSLHADTTLEWTKAPDGTSTVWSNSGRHFYAAVTQSPPGERVVVVHNGSTLGSYYNIKALGVGHGTNACYLAVVQEDTNKHFETHYRYYVNGRPSGLPYRSVDVVNATFPIVVGWTGEEHFVHVAEERHGPYKSVSGRLNDRDRSRWCPDQPVDMDYEVPPRSESLTSAPTAPILHYAFEARRMDNSRLLCVDGVEYNNGGMPMRYPHESGRLLHVEQVRADGTSAVVAGGVRQPFECKAIQTFIDSPNTNDLIYIIRTDTNRVAVVYNGTRGPDFDAVYDYGFVKGSAAVSQTRPEDSVYREESIGLAAHTNLFLYVGVHDDWRNGSMQLAVQGIVGPRFASLVSLRHEHATMPISFKDIWATPDGSQVAYQVVSAGRVVLITGQKVMPCNGVVTHCLMDASQRRIAYRTKRPVKFTRRTVTTYRPEYSTGPGGAMSGEVWHDPHGGLQSSESMVPSKWEYTYWVDGMEVFRCIPSSAEDIESHDDSGVLQFSGNGGALEWRRGDVVCRWRIPRRPASVSARSVGSTVLVIGAAGMVVVTVKKILGIRSGQ